MLFFRGSNYPSNSKKKLNFRRFSVHYENAPTQAHYVYAKSPVIRSRMLRDCRTIIQGILGFPLVHWFFSKRALPLVFVG